MDEMMVDAFMEMMAKDMGLSKEDLMADFAAFNASIDAYKEQGMSEEDATARVSETWNFPNLDLPAKE